MSFWQHVTTYKKAFSFDNIGTPATPYCLSSYCAHKYVQNKSLLSVYIASCLKKKVCKCSGNASPRYHGFEFDAHLQPTFFLCIYMYKNMSLSPIYIASS